MKHRKTRLAVSLAAAALSSPLSLVAYAQVQELPSMTVSASALGQSTDDMIQPSAVLQGDDWIGPHWAIAWSHCLVFGPAVLVRVSAGQ